MSWRDKIEEVLHVMELNLKKCHQFYSRDSPHFFGLVEGFSKV